MERVGVVIPSYNHGAFVGDAVRSVLGQTVDGVELVVVDDGSSDDSAEAVRAAFAGFPGRRATLIEQANAGAHAAIARGMAELDTPVLAVLNSDDAYEPDRFERVLPGLGGPLAIAFTGLTIIDERGAELPVSHDWPRWYRLALTAAETEPTIGFALLMHNFSVTSGNFVFTRGLYERLGGFGDQKFAHDWDFVIRSVALTEPVFVPERLMRYRVHGANTTETVRGLMQAECDRAMERYADLLEAAGDDANALAPCARGWPYYWGRFGGRRGFLGEIGRLAWYERLAGAGRPGGPAMRPQ